MPAVVAEDLLTNFGSEDFRFSATTPMGDASAVAAPQCAAMAVADHQASRMVVDSFRLFDCCLENDGGGEPARGRPEGDRGLRELK